MTLSALLLGRRFFSAQPSRRLRYATLGLLFVNVSIGGTLTHFAAPPVLMVARPWGWDTFYMLTHFGWHAVLAIALSTVAYFLLFNRELLKLKPGYAEEDDERASVSPAWLIAANVAFIGWTVLTSHYAAFFIGGFLIFLGFAKATAEHQGRLELRNPLLVGFFLGGLVIHGGLQGWWIGPILSRLPELPLFAGAAILTSFNDNALITYLATLVPTLADPLKHAVVSGAVVGGGLTVIANAPNPAGQALLAKYFDNAIIPIWLFVGALTPTLIAFGIFLL
jgi:Na+/H+ antiporter NhaD/arsenite permease-like protein